MNKCEALNLLCIPGQLEMNLWIGERREGPSLQYKLRLGRKICGNIRKTKEAGATQKLEVTKNISCMANE